jgi:hypothetical protein
MIETSRESTMPDQNDQDAFEQAILRYDESPERQAQRELRYFYLGPVAPNKIQQLRVSLNEEVRVVGAKKMRVRYVSVRWWLQRRDQSWHASRVEIKLDAKTSPAVMVAIGEAMDVMHLDETELVDL